MTRAKLTITMDNAAFEGENCGPELARILREAAGEAENLTYIGKRATMVLRDINGNRVGCLTVT